MNIVISHEPLDFSPGSVRKPNFDNYYIDNNDKYNYINVDVPQKIYIKFVKKFIFTPPDRYVKIRFDGKLLKTGESFVINISNVINTKIEIHPNPLDLSEMATGTLLISR